MTLKDKSDEHTEDEGRVENIAKIVEMLTNMLYLRNLQEKQSKADDTVSDNTQKRIIEELDSIKKQLADIKKDLDELKLRPIIYPVYPPAQPVYPTYPYIIYTVSTTQS